MLIGAHPHAFRSRGQGCCERIKGLSGDRGEPAQWLRRFVETFDERLAMGLADRVR